MAAVDLALLVVSTAATWAVIEFGLRWLRIAARVATGGAEFDD